MTLVSGPALWAVFGTAPFAPAKWLFALAWAPLPLAVDRVRKALGRGRSR